MKKISKNKIPDSMFGLLKGKVKSFTKKERESLWKDKYRGM